MSPLKYLLPCLCFTFCITSAVAEDKISELMLSNGLKIIIKSDHRSPIVVFQVWYKVGSADAQKGHTGISHLLEHMMYRGMKNPQLEDVYRKMSLIGSQGNAYTTRDYTFYYHVVEKKYLHLAFAVEAERMRYLVIDKNEFNIEKKIIQEEWLNNNSKDPYLPASNALYNMAFENEAYQFPVIGQMQDQAALSIDKVLSWYESHYTPDNAILVIVGDINASNTFSLARKYFANIKKKSKISEHQFSSDKIQLALKQKKTRIIMPETTKVAMILLAFKVPSIKTSEPTWEAYALDVLAGWFDSGLDSRLTKALVKDRRVAHEVFVHYSPMNKKESLFIIEATPAQNISIKQLEWTLIKEIKRLKKETISRKTLQKIKNQMIATEIFERDSMLIQARIIGQAESVGISWLEDREYINRIKAVSPEQVKSVFQRYLNLDKKFIAIQNKHDNGRE